MENKIIKRAIEKSILILGFTLFLGIVLGVIFEKAIPSEYNFTILSEKDIYSNNITTLKQTIGYGFLSFGVYSVYFCFIFGRLVGQGVTILFSNYGINGIVYGFLPHAIIETASCICASVLSMFWWNIILNTFFKKNNILKKRILPKTFVIMTIIAVLTLFFCCLAAYIEYNITEMFWQNQ